MPDSPRFPAGDDYVDYGWFWPSGLLTVGAVLVILALAVVGAVTVVRWVLALATGG